MESLKRIVDALVFAILVPVAGYIFVIGGMFAVAGLPQMSPLSALFSILLVVGFAAVFLLGAFTRMLKIFRETSVTSPVFWSIFLTFAYLVVLGLLLAYYMA